MCPKQACLNQQIRECPDGTVSVTLCGCQQCVPAPKPCDPAPVTPQCQGQAVLVNPPPGVCADPHCECKLNCPKEPVTCTGLTKLYTPTADECDCPRCIIKVQCKIACPNPVTICPTDQVLIEPKGAECFCKRCEPKDPAPPSGCPEKITA